MFQLLKWDTPVQPKSESSDLTVAPDLLDQTKTALNDRLDVKREIGRGGMATVFLAEELHPRRNVAVKVLEPHLATELARERFLREVEFSSQLIHPNIVPIFHAGEVNGLLYYVMPFIDGQSLRSLIARKGKIPLEETLRILGEAGDALEYAHDQGVIHRDIKPENILLAHGHAYVADFGIARALCVACGDNLTIAGIPIGTPGYMSPEQGSGEEVDGRADVYSLAAVAYEMLTGSQPFRGPTIEAIIAARYMQPVPTLRGAGWTESATVDAAIERALQLEPDDRFATIAEFMTSVTPQTAAAPVPDTLPPTLPQEPLVRSGPSVAVLPFANLSADPDNEYFSDGITDDIITQLSKFDQLKITSRTSVLRYKGTNKTMAQIAKELGVTNVLEGSVRRARNRVRVVAQLIDAKTDRHLWAESFDRELTDIFEIQSEIADRIAGALQSTLTHQEVREAPRKPTDNLEAYNLYLQGRFFWSKFTPPGLHRAIEFFQKAVELDPEYALAHSGLADAYVLLTVTLGLLPPGEGMPKAKAAAQRALSLDDELADAHSSLGAIHDWYDWDFEAAAKHHEQAVKLAPREEKPRMLHSFHLSAMGRLTEAIAQARAAAEYCPTSVSASAVVGLHLYKTGRYDEALAQLEKSRELDENHPTIYIALTWTYLKKGMTKEAVQTAHTAAQLTSSPPPRRAALGCVLAADGQTEEAERILSELTASRDTEYVSPLDIALVTTSLGKVDETFGWFEKAFQERAPWLNHLKTDPLWEPLRSDTRFQDLAKRVGIP